jgi:hypothetical protein
VNERHRSRAAGRQIYNVDLRITADGLVVPLGVNRIE